MSSTPTQRASQDKERKVTNVSKLTKQQAEDKADSRDVVAEFYIWSGHVKDTRSREKQDNDPMAVLTKEKRRKGIVDALAITGQTKKDVWQEGDYFVGRAIRLKDPSTGEVDHDDFRAVADCLVDIAWVGGWYNRTFDGEFTGNINIKIPHQCASAIIGAGGSIIEDMKARTGNQVIVTDYNEDEPTRTVRIWGTDKIEVGKTCYAVVGRVHAHLNEYNYEEAEAAYEEAEAEAKAVKKEASPRTPTPPSGDSKRPSLVVGAREPPSPAPGSKKPSSISGGSLNDGPPPLVAIATPPPTRLPLPAVGGSAGVGGAAAGDTTKIGKVVVPDTKPKPIVVTPSPAGSKKPSLADGVDTVLYTPVARPNGLGLYDRPAGVPVGVPTGPTGSIGMLPASIHGMSMMYPLGQLFLPPSLPMTAAVTTMPSVKQGDDEVSTATSNSSVSRSSPLSFVSPVSSPMGSVGVGVGVGSSGVGSSAGMTGGAATAFKYVTPQRPLVQLQHPQRPPFMSPLLIPSMSPSVPKPASPPSPPQVGVAAAGSGGLAGGLAGGIRGGASVGTSVPEALPVTWHMWIVDSSNMQTILLQLVSIGCQFQVAPLTLDQTRMSITVYGGVTEINLANTIITQAICSAVASV